MKVVSRELQAAFLFAVVIWECGSEDGLLSNLWETRVADNRNTNVDPERLSTGVSPLRLMYAVVAFASLPLFLGAVLSNWAYASSYQVQWTNFADWLNVGGLTLAVIALALGALAQIFRPWRQPGRRWLDVALLAATVILGTVNAFVYAKDGWAAMPAAMFLSVIVLVLAAAATVVGLSRVRSGVQP